MTRGAKALVLAQAVLALGLWHAYVTTLSPAFPPDDSPETISAAAVLGVQHPPGYPLAALLGRCAVALVPLGSAAWRMNCLSALLAVLVCAAAAAFVHRALSRFGPALPPALGASIALACAAGLGLSANFWRCATGAKGGIYLLNSLLLLGLMDSCARLAGGAEKDRARPLAVWAFCAGLALANHYPSTLVCMAAMLPPLTWSLRGHRRWALPALLLAAGLAVYAYLPLRAAFHPAINAGNVRSWGSFWWTVLREGYRSDSARLAPSVLAERLADWWGYFRTEWGWGAPLLALAGVWALARPGNDAAPRRAFLALLAGIWAAIFAAVVVLNRTPSVILSVQDNFFLPQDLQVWALAGFGAALAAARLRPAPWAALALSAALAPCAFLAASAARPPALDRSADFSYYDFGKGILMSLPREAVYLPEGDFYFMPVYYGQLIEGRRPDVAMVHRNRFYSLGGFDDLKALRPGLVVELVPGTTTLQCLIHANASAYPFCVGTYHESLQAKDLDGGFLVQCGLVNRVEGTPLSWPPARLGMALPYRPFLGPAVDMDPAVKGLMQWYRESWLEQARELRMRAKGSSGREAADFAALAAHYDTMAASLLGRTKL